MRLTIRRRHYAQLDTLVGKCEYFNRFLYKKICTIPMGTYGLVLDLYRKAKMSKVKQTIPLHCKGKVILFVEYPLCNISKIIVVYDTKVYYSIRMYIFIWKTQKVYIFIAPGCHLFISLFHYLLYL